MSLLEKAGDGSVPDEAFNAVVDVVESGSGPVTAADIDSQAASDGWVLTADGAGNSAFEAASGGVPTSRTLTAGAALTGGGDLSADRTFDVAVDGSTLEVNADALRVKALGITDSQVASANKDGVTGTASMRTLGTGAQQAAAGNDSRLSDSRAPNGSAGGDLTGTYPNPTLATAGGGAAGPTGSATVIPIVTVDAKGRVTALSSATAAPTNAAGGDLTGNYPNPTLAAAGGGAAGPLGSATVTPIVTVDAKGRVTALSSATTVPTNAAGGDLTGNYPNPTIGSGKVTSAMIADGTIVNADVNASAAIVYSKLSLSGSLTLADHATAAVTSLSGFSTAWTVVVKSLDESVASSTTLQADDELTFTPASGGLYEFELYVIIVSPSGVSAGNWKFAFGEDGTSRGTLFVEGIGTAGTQGNSQGTVRNVGIAAFQTIATNRPIKIDGSLVGAGAACPLLWAQNVSDGNNVTVKAGSLLRTRRIL